MTAKNCANGPKLVLKDLCGKSLVQNVLYSYSPVYCFHTFSKALTRRICLSMEIIFSWWSFPLFSWPFCVMQGLYCQEKLYASHFQKLKILFIQLIELTMNIEQGDPKPGNIHNCLEISEQFGNKNPICFTHLWLLLLIMIYSTANGCDHGHCCYDIC